MIVQPLAAAHREGFRALMDAAGLGCFCRYWHFGGSKNDWLERSALRPEENEAEQFRDPCAVDARGLVAIDDGVLVGWMKVVPQPAVPKLLQQSVYKKLVRAESDVHAIGCLLVHPDHRERGVARALLHAAPDFARAHGARELQAYPRRSDDRLPDAQALMGPEALFRSEGFELAHDVPPYPVWRKWL
jgi:GNAT superfamily N-acetyltransferase